MYGTAIRSALLLVGGSLLYVPFSMAGEAVESTISDLGAGGSSTAHWVGATTTWLPMIILAMIAVMWIASAATRRGGVR